MSVVTDVGTVVAGTAVSLVTDVGAVVTGAIIGAVVVVVEPGEDAGVNVEAGDDFTGHSVALKTIDVRQT